MAFFLVSTIQIGILMPNGDFVIVFRKATGFLNRGQIYSNRTSSQEKLSVRWSSQAGQIVLTAGQFSCPFPASLNKITGSSRSPERSNEY